MSKNLGRNSDQLSINSQQSTLVNLDPGRLGLAWFGSVRLVQLGSTW